MLDVWRIQVARARKVVVVEEEEREEEGEVESWGNQSDSSPHSSHTEHLGGRWRWWDGL